MEDLWKIVTASAIGTSIGSSLLEFLKEQIKDSFSHKRDIKKTKSDKINEKRISIYEDLYDLIYKLSEINATNDLIESQIIVIERFLREKNLYIEEKLSGIVYRYCDYFKDILNGNSRNISIEESFIKEYKDFFNK